VYILLIQNALYVPSLDHNLLPPFMMREAGVIVKDAPKIQLEDPSKEDHALTFPETGFRIRCHSGESFHISKQPKQPRMILLSLKKSTC
jgi:hypothetical protein